jgi:hypothetical protein
MTYYLQWIWHALAEGLSLPVRGLLVALGWITFDDEFYDEGFHVHVYIAKGFFLKHLWPSCFSGVSWLPGAIILSPVLYMPGERNHRDRVTMHELEHMRQWRKWSILFPLVYGIFSLKAWPNVYQDNRFEVEARAVVEKAYPQ